MNNLNNLHKELSDLQSEFTNKVNEIADKYFKNKDGLLVLTGNEQFAVSFYIDFDCLKNSKLKERNIEVLYSFKTFHHFDNDYVCLVEPIVLNKESS